MRRAGTAVSLVIILIALALPPGPMLVAADPFTNRTVTVSQIPPLWPETTTEAPPTPLPTPTSTYSGPTQVPSSPLIVTQTQTLVTCATLDAMLIAQSFARLNLQYHISPSTTVDEILASIYTRAAAQHLCQLLSYFVSSRDFHGVSPITARINLAASTIGLNVSSVAFSGRNATCSVGNFVSTSIAILTSVPQSEDELGNLTFPPTFAVLVQVRSRYAETVIAWMQTVLSAKYDAPMKPRDLRQSLGFLSLTYGSPAFPGQSTIESYTVSKDTPFAAGSGIAVWTFLLIQAMSLCGAVTIGMTVVRWVIKPPPLPSLKERIMMMESSAAVAALSAQEDEHYFNSSLATSPPATPNLTSEK